MRVGFPLVQPHSRNNSHPERIGPAGRELQSQPSIVLEPRLYQSPHVLDCALLSVVPAAPHMLAVEKLRLSKPGTATSRLSWPFPHPELQGGHRFFFMTIARQSGFLADSFVTRRQRPQPPPPSGSEPQHPSSEPSIAESASLVAPVSHICSPYTVPP